MAEWLLQREKSGDIGINVRGERLRWVAPGLETTREALEDENFPVTFNAPHPDFAGLLCSNIRINAIGFKLMSVEATYTVPEGGQNQHNPSEPSQTNPLVYSWATVQETVAIDTAIHEQDRVAILNSAGSWPGDGIVNTLNYKRLTITRWQTSYDNGLAQSYENRVNSHTFEGAPAGSVKCAIIQPSTSYTAIDALIPVDHVFDFKDPEIWGNEPWQTQFVDAGVFGIALIEGNPKKVRLCDEFDNPTQIELLNGKGKPIDPSITYLGEDGKAVENPNWAEPDPPTGAEIVNVGTRVMLRYYTLPETDLDGLGL